MATRSPGSKLPALALLAALSFSAAASAQPAPTGGRLVARVSRDETSPDHWPAWVHQIFVGVTGGYGYAIVKHPDLATPAMPGPILAFQAGYAVNRRLTLGLVYTDFERAAARSNGGEGFSVAALHAQAECVNCKPATTGGTPLATTFRLGTLGPSLDITPFGRDGLYLGASGGLAMGSALSTYYGVGGTARGGFRFRPVEMVTISLEGGAQAQTFGGGYGRLGYGAAEVRLHL